MSLAPRLVAAIAALVVTGGATTLWAPWSDDPEPDLTGPGPAAVTYAVTGTLSIYGLNPLPNGTDVQPETLTVTLGNTTTVLDAARRPVTAVNVTFHAGDLWATHWIHPGTDQVVVVTTPDKRERYHFGIQWSWQHSGEPAPSPRRRFGRTGSRCRRGNSRSSITRCWTKRSPRLATSGHRLSPLASTKSTWNHHHPPPGQAPTVTPLNRAIEGGRANDPSLDQWLDDHPDWQVVFGSYDFKESMVSRGEWSIEFQAANGDRTARTIEESIYTEGQAGSPPVRTYAVETDEPNWPPGWTDKEGAQLVGLTDAWSRMASFVGDEDIIRRSFDQDTSEDETAWTARIYYTGIKQGDTRLLERVDMDMEAGLLVLYTGWQTPQEALGTTPR